MHDTSTGTEKICDDEDLAPPTYTHTHTGFHGDVTAGSPMGHSVDIKGVYISSGVFVCRDNVLYVADVYSVDINIKHWTLAKMVTHVTELKQHHTFVKKKEKLSKFYLSGTGY